MLQSCRCAQEKFLVMSYYRTFLHEILEQKRKKFTSKKHVDLNNLLWILKIISKGILPLIPLWEIILCI